MLTSPVDTHAPAGTTHSLESSVSALELGLQNLGEALMARDAHGIDQASDRLQRALIAALSNFQQAAREGHVPPELRRRLVSAGGHIAAQRDAVARAAASLDRAIDILLPDTRVPSLYEAHGASHRGSHASMHA